jgi:hypothetical protein
MCAITRPLFQLSLCVTPPSDRARNDFTLADRLRRLDEAIEGMRGLCLGWYSSHTAEHRYDDFETRLREGTPEVARAGVEVMLAAAEAKLRQDHPARFTLGETEFRLANPEPRSFNTSPGSESCATTAAMPGL